jgi:hypothetical protein
MTRPGTGNTKLAKKFGNESVTRWISRFLIRLASAGYKPGFRWGSEFYFDFFDYLRVVAEVEGRSPVDLAVKLAIQVLTKKDLPEDEEDDYSWIDESLKPSSLEDVEGGILLTLEGATDPRQEEDYSWIETAMR